MFKLVLKKLLKILLVTLTVLTVMATVVGLAFSIYVDRYIEKDIDESLFYVVGSESQTRIFYYEYEDRANRIGEAVELSEEIYGGYRSEFASFEEIPEDMINAFISIEDKRFYDHNGVDWFRTASAGVNYYLKFRDSYGGSTITQQLIKNVTDRDDYSFQRKLQEIFWALDLETKMDKREILELYLNIINLSQGCYGIGAAAKYYFSKEVSELTLSECACIAAITNSPTYYDPIRNPQNNERRRQLILSQMLDQGYISEEAYTAAKDETVVLHIKESNRESTVNSWYVDMVIEDVMNDLIEQYGYSRSMASLVVYTGGLRIYTVMDRDVQQVLEKYYENESNFYSVGEGETPQSSMIVIDSKTGDILGVAGAVGKKTANRLQNFATYTVRPAGSVIKPLSVYAPAMELGIVDWSTVYDDTPVNFGSYNLDENKGAIVEPSPWPKNSGGVYRGLTNVNYAIVHSVNTVAVKILEDLGLERSFDFLYNKLKLKSLISGKTLENGVYISDKDYAALALGQFNYGVTVREITAAYSIFSNGGIYNDYRSYYQVTDSKGEAVLERKYHGESVISRENADIMTEMLQNVVKEGTASEITLDEYVDCAGKTGTTQNKYDNWYIGYTPYYIGGVWMGYEYPKALNDYSGNRSIRIWNDIMTELHSEFIEGEGLLSFEKGEKVIECEYCADSGKLMTAACRMDPRGDRSEIGYFVEGREPSEPCDRHIAVCYDGVSGGVCIGDCPEENRKTVGLICVERSFPMEIYITDAQYTWRDIGIYILPETASSLPFYNNLANENEFFGVSNTKVQYNRACREHFNYFEWKKKQEAEE